MLELGNRFYLPMVVPVVLGKGQPSWELVDCGVVPVVPHLDLPMVVPEPLGLG